MPYRIVLYRRNPYAGQVSIERVFDEVAKHLSFSTVIEKRQAAFRSKGVLRRILDVLTICAPEGDIHHVTGDVHYLCFGLPTRNTVLTVHDCATLKRLSGLRRIVFKYLWFIGPFSRAKMVTTISYTMKSELIEYLGEVANSVRVVPNCVRKEFFYLPKKEVSSIPIVLQVGVGWNKNLENVAIAVRDANYFLEIIGNLRSEQILMLKRVGVAYKELGRLGDCDLVKAYHRCDILVFASFYEGFGLPIIEAQACGRPVVTSDRSSMPEVAGEGALYIDPDSSDDIRNAIERLVRDNKLRNKIVDCGLRNVERFRAKNIAEKYESIYMEVIEESGQ